MFTRPRTTTRRHTIRTAFRTPLAIADNSDEPRLTATQAVSLTGGDPERLASIAPLLRSGRRERRRLVRELQSGWDGAA
jgi:hypothetical protein